MQDVCLLDLSKQPLIFIINVKMNVLIYDVIVMNDIAIVLGYSRFVSSDRKFSPFDNG